MPEGVDAQSPNHLTPEQQTRLDGIRQLDSKVFSTARGVSGSG